MTKASKRNGSYKNSATAERFSSTSEYIDLSFAILISPWAARKVRAGSVGFRIQILVISVPFDQPSGEEHDLYGLNDWNDLNRSALSCRHRASGIEFFEEFDDLRIARQLFDRALHIFSQQRCRLFADEFLVVFVK